MSAQANDEIRSHVHAMWALVASHWGDYAEVVDERGGPVCARMLDAAAVHAGDRVIELASGPGGVGLAAAVLVGAGGHVVISDVAAEMAAIAGARGSERGLTNVSTATLDLEDIDQPDGSFDVVLCREGLMFALEPSRAIAELLRVLRPGGRAAVAVWASKSENPWLGIVFDAVADVVGMQVPPPGIPGPFALGDQARLTDLFEAAGFAAVRVERLQAPLLAPSFEAWRSRTTALAGPLAALLAGLDDHTRAALDDRLRAAVEPYATPNGLVLPGTALLVVAHRP